MKNIKIFYFLLLIPALSNCSRGQVQNSNVNLTPEQFVEKTKQLPDVVIIDVRTPEEFSRSYIDNAVNIDWLGNNFDSHINLIDKDKPVIVYCASGNRSASAANSMRSKGFKEVYELKGGIVKWASENYPVIKKNSKNTGMSMAEFQKVVNSDKQVLVDFYAEWCLPCKKMEPFLAEIAREMPDKVEVVRINVDNNMDLYKELKVDAIPVLQIYRDNELSWSHQGFITKEEIIKQLH